jgi:chemotaxis response regulator CheB
MPEPAEPFLVVGLGASAGGIAVLQEFFRQVPGDDR